MDNGLFESGIHTEKSDIRAHVSLVNKTVYVYQTCQGLKAIEEYNPPLRPAGQDGVEGVTAMGWLVKVEWIEGLRKLRASLWPGWAELAREKTTSRKGALAVECVTYTMRKGRFPFWVDAYEDDRLSIQVKGTDIVVFNRHWVQVKCDRRCGEKPNGTGNLYLQQAERNPLKRY